MVNISVKIQSWYWFTAGLFFGFVAFRLDRRSSFAEIQLCDVVVSKADLFVDRALSLVW